MSYYDRGKDTLVSMNHLSENQLAALRESLFAVDTLSSGDMSLADLVEKKNDPELLDFFIDKLKRDKIERSWIKIWVVEKIASMSDRADLKEVYSKISTMDLDYTHENYEKTFSVFLKEFIDLL